MCAVDLWALGDAGRPADIPFTITRAAGFFLSRHFSAMQLFRAGFVGASCSLVLVGLAGPTNSSILLWGGTALFGFASDRASPTLWGWPVSG